MKKEIVNILTSLELNPPAEKSEIEEVEKALNIKFPNDYCEFMLYSNGVEGLIGENSYVAIWSVNDIVEYNNCYQVEKYNPGLVYFGSDGGDTAYAFDKRITDIKIVQLPFISIDCKEITLCGANFYEFLKSL